MSFSDTLTRNKCGSNDWVLQYRSLINSQRNVHIKFKIVKHRRKLQDQHTHSDKSIKNQNIPKISNGDVRTQQDE